MDSPEHTDDQSLPKHTTPTWEMELLVSGGTVFGLIQLSGLVDDRFVSLYNRASEDLGYTLMPLWIYVKFVLVILIGTYLVHLCLRGYWVAMVGMNSVYSGGVDWGKLHLGPLSRQYAEKNAPTIPAAIEKVDNLATRVFGIGFSFATTMLFLVVFAAFSLVLSLAIKQVFDLENTRWVFGTIVAIVLVPWSVATVIDHRWGGRFREGSLPYRILYATFALYERLGIGNTTNPLASIFISGGGGMKRWGLLGLAALSFALVVLFSLASITGGGLPIDKIPGLPDSDPYAADSVPADFYASQRSAPDDLLPLPYIPDRTVRGPYLELFVPYIPRKHTPAMRRACPEAVVRSKKDVSRESLDCLAKLQDVQLDGKPLALVFDASSDARSGQPGMLAMVPVRQLAPGRHELSLFAIDPRREKDGKPARRYRIPFWK